LVNLILTIEGYQPTKNFQLAKMDGKDLLKLENELQEITSQLQNFRALTSKQKSQLENRVNRLAPKVSKCKQIEPNNIESAVCTLLLSLDNDLVGLLFEVKMLKKAYPEFFKDSKTHMLPNFENNLKGRVIPFLIHLSRLGQQMRDKAFRWAIGSTSGLPKEFLDRIAIVNLIVSNSELGNQIKARADALAKQLKDEGVDRRELPPSIALREAEATDFINLYQWFNATIPDFRADWFLGIGTVEDRVKVVERLFSDHFWSKINTVYASGRGKVSMALIKDDVGNWNLKSFDNDPEELLNAYKDFTVEMIKKATELAASAAGGGGTEVAKQLLGMANQTAFEGPNSGSTSQTQGILEGLREDLVLKLKKEKEKFANLDEIKGKSMARLVQPVEELLSDYSRLMDLVAKSANP